MKACFDIETDGLLDQMTHVKCLNIVDIDTGIHYRFTDYTHYEDIRTGKPTDVPTKRDGNIAAGLDMLRQSEEVSGQNITGFDIPALTKLYGWEPAEGQKVFDTLTYSKLLYTDLKARDFHAIKQGKLADMPKYLIGTHKLESWGHRLGKALKTHFVPTEHDRWVGDEIVGKWSWNEYPFSEQCDDYCADDVEATIHLVQHMRKRAAEMGVTEEAIELENQVNYIIQMQQDHGWLFDSEAAEKLVAELQGEKIEHEQKLQQVFGEFYLKNGKAAVTKRSMKRFVESPFGSTVRTVKRKTESGETITVEQHGWYDYRVEGSEHQPIKLVQFNPGSRAHIALRLQRQYDWEPVEFTPNGQPKIDETILGTLPFPEAKLMAEYFGITKKLGQVAEGDNSFLKMVKKDGRIHGRVNTCGAVTGRMTHSKPNVAQADKDHRVRALFIVPEGYKLVGMDADSLEGRCKGHYLAKFDGGAFIKMLLEGRKEDGTDLHTTNQKNAGLNSRDNAKTLYYAWLYGAGDYKLGTIVYDDFDDEKKDRFNTRFKGEERNRRLARLGKKARAGLLEGIAGLSKLIDAVKKRAATRGYIIGLDGRRVLCRTQHAALNTLLQSAGALIMKKALVLTEQKLQELGLVHGEDYAYVGNIHDEIQMEVRIEHADTVGATAAESVRLAGEHFAFRCPLVGNYDVGDNWSETH